MVLADTGEDQIINCVNCSYAANLERAEVKTPHVPSDMNSGDMNTLEAVDTPDIKTMEEVTSFLTISPDQLIKTLIFVADEEVVAALVRGDHELNEVKLKNFLGAQVVELADAALVEETTGAPMGFAGPVGLKARMVADNAIRGMKNFVTGGNKKDLHLKNVNMEGILK